MLKEQLIVKGQELDAEIHLNTEKSRKHSESLRELEEQLNSLKSKNSKILVTLEESKQTISVSKNKVKIKDAKIASLHSESDRWQNRTFDLEGKIQLLEDDLSSVKEELQTMQTVNESMTEQRNKLKSEVGERLVKI